MKAFLLVRARIEDPALRPRFEEWYRSHHLEFARSRFDAEHALRLWSQDDPAAHIALYRFASIAALKAAMVPENLNPLLADFDAAWPQIGRTREVLEMVDERHA